MISEKHVNASRNSHRRLFRICGKVRAFHGARITTDEFFTRESISNPPHFWINLISSAIKFFLDETSHISHPGTPAGNSGRRTERSEIINTKNAYKYNIILFGCVLSARCISPFWPVGITIFRVVAKERHKYEKRRIFRDVPI